MTIKNNNIGDKNRKISGKKIMLVTALLSGGVIIRVNNHINHSFGNPSREVINFDLRLESTDVLIDDSGTFYVGQGTPIDNFDIADFVTIIDEDGNLIPKSEVTLEWDVKEYFEGTTFGTKGEFLITINASMNDGRTGELEYKLVVKEGHVFEEIKTIENIEVDVNNTKDILEFQEYFRVLNSTTGADTGAQIKSTLEDEDLQSVGSTQIIFYTELDGTKFTNSVHISVVDTVAPTIKPVDSFDKEGIEWNKEQKTITVSELDKNLGDFSLDQYATAYDASGDYELSWNFDEVMDGQLGKIDSHTVVITAIDAVGNEATTEVYVDISTVSVEFKEGISKVAFELFHTPDLNDPMNKVGAFYDVLDATGNPVADDRISWDLTKEMLSTLGEYRLTIEVLDNNDELIGVKGVTVEVKDTTAPEAKLVQGARTSFDIEVDQFNSIDKLYMYLDGISSLDDLVTISDNSGVWGYRFEYNGQPLTDELLKTVGVKGITLLVFDYDNEGNELNENYLTDENGLPLDIIFNVIDTQKASIVVTDEVINLEVMQNATKEMIEINNYAEISDNSGVFTWELRVKGSPDEVMDYADMLGKITPQQGVELELVVRDASGNVTYSDMLLIVTDTEAPVFEVRKSEETININPSAAEINEYRNINSYVRVSDNSGKYTLSWDFDQVIGQASIAGVYDVTIKAIDEAGNVTEEMITFTVVDNEAPSIVVNTKTIEIEANEYKDKDELEFDINLNDYITVTDNSNGLIDTTFDYTNVDFGEIGTYEVIITASDAAGNETINIIELKVIAGDPKVNVLRDYEVVNTIQIDAQHTFTGIKVVTKDGKIVIERATSADSDEVLSYLTMENLLEFLTISGETIESAIWDLSTLDVTTVGTNDIQLTVTNNFGKTSVQTIEFVVIYEYDSLIKVSGENFIDVEIDTTLNMDEAWFKNNYDVTNYVEYRASGGTANIVWLSASFQNIDFNKVGTYILSAAVTDGHNETENVSLNLNVIDTTGAVISAADSTTIQINDYDANDYDVNTFASVTDNSDVAGVSTVTLSWNLDTQVDFTKVGTYVVTIKAIDASGNETTKEITFEVEDTQPPVLTINSGMDTQTIEINSRDASNFNINSFATAMDNSGVVPTLEWDIGSVDFGTTGTYTIIIKATDNSGNESNEVTVTFEVVDTIAPSIDIDTAGLEELKVEIATKTESDYSDWLEDYVTVTDNSGESITPSWDITGVDFNTFGTYMVTITAIDASGNTTTQVVSFGVSDTTAPVITIKDNKEITTLEVFDGKLADFTLADFATCSDASTCTIEWDIQNVDFSTVGTYVVTIKAVDIYGNESRSEITIEIEDNTKPEIVITRPDILISMDKYTSSYFNVNDFAKVTDNYDKSVVLTWNIDDVDFNTVGEYKVVISAIDSSGNEAEEKEVIFKVEEFNITLTEVIAFAIEVDQGNLESNFNVNDYFSAADQNGVAVDNIVWNLTDDMLRTYGTYGVILTISFDGNKEVEMEVTLEVVDNTDPNVAVDTTTTTIELGDSSTFDNLNPEDFVTVTDNSNDVTYSWDFDNVVEQTVAGTYTVAITVTDVAGNETVVTTEIVVEDTVAPDLVLNDDFDRNNMTWSKSTVELSILAGDKAPGEIDLWELVTATDLSTGGLTISWNLADAELNQVGHYTVDIEVSDGTLTSTETITVNVLRATPILNDFNVDKSYNDVTVNVDVTNLNEAITSLVITLQELDGTVVDTYTQTLSALDAYTINHVFNTGVTSNTEYKVVLEYKYSLQEDKTTQVETVTDTKDVKTLAYAQNDVLGTITDMYIKHEEITVNYELSNEFNLVSNAKIVLTDSSNTPVEHQITDMSTSSGTYVFAGLKSNTEYKIEIILDYNFNDGNNVQTKTSDMRDVETLEYTEHDVIADITGITQTPSTISVDYNITDIYSLMIGTGMAKIYKADDMTTVVANQPLTGLNGTISFNNLLANTSYIVIIETSLDLVQDGSNTVSMVKETGLQTTTESYSVDEIVVNIDNVIVDYNEITFDYGVHDINNLIVNPTTTGVWLSINGTRHNLTSLTGTSVKLSTFETVLSNKAYDIQIHFEYNLKDGLGNISYTGDKYQLEETTFEYDEDRDLTLTSHNLASDTQTIYVDYSLRNLNNIGDMSTLSVTITDGTNTEEIMLSDYFSALGFVPLEGLIEIKDINSVDLVLDTMYTVSMEINYDLKDGAGLQTDLLLLQETQIKTQAQELAGYNVISAVERNYTSLITTFDIENTLGHADLNTFQIALFDTNDNAVPGYEFKHFTTAAIGTHSFEFENLLSDAEYKIIYRIENPNYNGGGNGENEFIDIERRVSTRTYDINLIDIDYTLVEGLTFLQLKDIEITNVNENFEKITYNSVILTISYTRRDGQLITEERDLGSLTEGDLTTELFTSIQSNTDVNIEFRLEYDLKDGAGIQSGSNELVRTFEEKTLEYDFTFVIENDEVLVTGLTPGFSGDHLVIFEEVEGYTVKDIKADAFYGENITFSQLTIPRTLETVGQNAFRNVSLTTVNLTSVFETIPTVSPRMSTYSTQGILVIGDNAFRDNAIVGFDFSTTETIGVSAFRNNKLGSIVLGDSITNVGQEAFVNGGVVNLTTGSLLSDGNFGIDSFVGNSIINLTIGNIGFKHSTLGYSGDVFASTGFKLTFANSAQGNIENQSWRYDKTNSTRSHAPIIDLSIGDGITGIGTSAFYGNTLNDVVIGDGVEIIGFNAFDSTGISTLTLGKSLVTINDAAFNNNNLTSIILPESVKDIETRAFWNNNIQELVVPDSVDYIGDGAFRDNDMKKLSIGELLSDNSFGLDTFTGNQINDLTIGNIGFKHSSLGYSGDVFDTSGYSLTIADSAEGYIANQAWRYDATSSTRSHAPIIDLTIGNGITGIGTSAFYGNTLNEVVIGDNVETIGFNSFDSTGISKLTLGKSLVTINDAAFNNNNLTSIVLPESVKTIATRAFWNNDITELVVPDSVDYIGDGAFRDNNMEKLSIGELLSDSSFGIDTFTGNKINDLTIGNIGFEHSSLGYSGDVFASTGFKLTFADSADGYIANQSWRYDKSNTSRSHAPIIDLAIGDGITGIGTSAFLGNTLSEVVIGDNVETISYNAFESTGITKLTLGNSLRVISDAAFGDNNIGELVLPDSLEEIGNRAFDANAITKLTIGENIDLDNLGSNTFRGNIVSELITSNPNIVHNTLADSSSMVFNNNGFKITYTENAIGEIPTNAWRFSNGQSDVKINELILSDGITKIGDYAFSNNDFRGINLTENILSVGISAFDGVGATTIVLNDSLKDISKYAFRNNDLITVAIPEGLNSMGTYAFQNNKITTFNFINSMSVIPDGLFQNNNITSVVLPSHVTDIGAYAFADNDISNLELNGNITTFNDGVFQNNKLSSFKIEAHVGVIGKRAFYGNEILELVIPANVTLIDDEAFADNKVLRKLTINDGITTSIFGINTFAENAIDELIVGSTDFKHNTFGASESVFNTTTGLSLTFTDNAIGQIVDNAWEYTSDSTTSNVQLSGISIGNSITSIGNYAFLGNNLQKVVIGDSVSYVDDNAFENNGMTDLVIGELLSDNEFGKDTFLTNKIKDLTIGNIGFKHSSLGYSKNVFDNAGFKLTFANSADGYIANQSWRYDTSDSSRSDVPIIDLTIGDGITGIGTSAFLGNTLTEVIIGDKVETISYNAFESTGISSLTLGSSLRVISDASFGDNNLREVILPASVEEIGSRAFDANGITKLTIGGTLTKVGSNIFRGNSITELITSDINITYDTLAESASDVFSSNGFKITYTDKAIGLIPSNAWRYGTAYSDTKINELVLGNGVETIGNYSFSNNNIDSIKLSEKITSVGVNSFDNNDASTLLLNDLLEVIGDNSFSNNLLTSVVITDNITSMGSYAFAENNITDFNFITGLTEVSSGLLDGNNISTLVLPEHITSIASYAFRGNGITDITLSDNITTIGTSAFQTNLFTELVLPSKISRIETNAFRSNKIDELVAPDNLAYIGTNAFTSNTMRKLTLNSRLVLSSFGGSSFSDNDIEELTLGNLVIGKSTLGSAKSVFNTNGYKLIYADSAAGSIANQSWRYDGNSSEVQITGLEIGDGITQIGTSAFNGNDLGEVVIGDNVHTIGLYAFNNAGVTKLSLGNNVNKIDENAFYSNNLTEVVIPASVTEMNTRAFKLNPNLRRVVFMGNKVISGSLAFDTTAVFYASDGVTIIT